MAFPVLVVLVPVRALPVLMIGAPASDAFQVGIDAMMRHACVALGNLLPV